MGTYAGQSTQGSYSIALGFITGRSNQGDNSIAIGVNVVEKSQGKNSIAIGNNIVAISVSTSVLLGNSITNNYSNTLVLNATTNALATLNANSCYMSPIRPLSTIGYGPYVQYMTWYNPTTKELCYNP